MYSWDESLSHFSLSVLPVGTTQKSHLARVWRAFLWTLNSCRVETPHHLDFAGLNRRKNVLFQDTFWGGFLQTPTASKMEIFKAWPLWLIGVQVWKHPQVHSADKTPGWSDVSSCLMGAVRAGLPPKRGIATGNNCGWSSHRSFHEPFIYRQA